MNPRSILGSNLNLVKVHNRQAILLNFLYNERLSRVELARQISLSTTTITNLTAELLEDGIIVEEKSTKPVADQRRVGRPREMLRLVPDARFAVGVHIGIGLFRVAVANLHAKIIHNNISFFDLSTPPETVLQEVAKLITKTIAESGVDSQRVIGVGIGASGLVDYEKGVNIFAPRLDWRDTPIVEILQTYLDLPICVDNNVRCMALGEAFFGAGRGVDVLAFVYGRVGVGAGLVVNGQVFRGSGAGAGEIGHMVMVRKDGDMCTCGKTGCLETLVSERILVKWQ
jgi:predicted NBD/HSP70 family sugar kinase